LGLNNQVNTVPKSVPARAMASTFRKYCPAAPGMLHSPVIQRPGSVNARPPDIIAPADMAVFAIFISLKVVFPRIFNKAMERTDTKMVGHGKALILRAVY